MVSPIALVKPAPSAEVADKLRELSDEAERGEITCAIVVTVRPGGGFRTFNLGEASSREIVGALEFAKYDVITANQPK